MSKKDIRLKVIERNIENRYTPIMLEQIDMAIDETFETVYDDFMTWIKKYQLDVFPERMSDLEKMMDKYRRDKYII